MSIIMTMGVKVCLIFINRTMWLDAHMKATT